MKKLFVAVCSFLVSCVLSGQGNDPVYNYTFKKDKHTLAASVALFAGITIYDRARTLELLDDREDVDRGRLWKIDRGALRQSSSSAKFASDIFLYGSAAPLLLITLLDKSNKKETGSILLMGLQGMLLQAAVNESVKLAFERPRPNIFQLGERALNKPISKNDTKSFYSGHTSTVAYFSFFSARVFSDLYPNSKWHYPVWALAAALPATTGYLRYRAGKHFPSDVLVGYVMGAGIGVLLPTFYKNDALELSTTGNGFAMVYRF